MLTIYHYSVNLLDKIMTKEKQEQYGLISIDEQEKKEGIARAITYNHFFSPFEHISFFFDPIPLDLVSKELYNNPVYKKGNIIYEHRINVETINVKAWEVVESPIKTNMLDNWSEQNKEEWADKVTALEEIYGDRGKTSSGLTKAILRYKGKTKDYFEKSFKNPNFSEENRSQYAAMVPHLFVYPIDGIVIPYEVVKIII